MAKILFTWELGEGAGHTTPYLQLIERLEASGHEVSFALRELHKARGQFGRLGVHIYQAPYMLARYCNVLNPIDSYARILNNSGYDSIAHLCALLEAWRNLFKLIEPDLIVFDFSPSAMLASREMACARLAIGTGFHLPPQTEPIPRFHNDPANADEAALLAQERVLLGTINGALATLGLAPIGRLAELLDADRTMLRSLPEMDHYRGRGKAEYVGMLESPGGAAPLWPAVSGPRVFGYLKNFPTLPDLLGYLNEQQYPTLVYGDNLPTEITHKFASASLQFVPAPLDMRAVGQMADIAVGNGTHGASVELLLAGVPQLMLPLYGEQELVANNIERLGAGLAAPKRIPEAMAAKLERLHRMPAFRDAAQAFSQTHAGFIGSAMTDSVFTAIESLLTER